MTESSSRAVFLSYASQDAVVASRIGEALRSGGIEVWFDAEGGLEHGDEWDGKIRRQIKECVLFIPVISANTQARIEGYFRIEWELAAQRAMGIASGVPFILPVVIDATREPDALVPDRFRVVQWMRLTGGVVPPEVQQRLVKLWSHRTGLLAHDTARREATAGPLREGERGCKCPTNPSDSEQAGVSGSKRAASFKTYAVVAAGVLVAGLAGYFFLGARPGAEEMAAPASAGAAGKTAVSATGDPSRVWPRDPDLRRAMEMIDGIDSIAEDFALAEEIANKAIARNSTDLEAVTVLARVHGAYLYRGFDRSDERRTSARRYAERAVQLGPNNPDGLATLGVYLINSRGEDFGRARELLDRAIALKPTDAFFHRQRDNALFLDPKVSEVESMASAERTAALFPNDALVHYELGRHFRDLGRMAEMERAFDRALALAPVANALVWKARVALWERGDLKELSVLLERVPSRARSTERVVVMKWALAMASGDVRDGLTAVESLTGKWIEDFSYNGPKALLIAQLLEVQGKRELARLQYEAALVEVKARQARAPTDAALRGTEAWILHGLGRDEEARPLSRMALETAPRPFRYGRLMEWWFTTIPRCLISGDRAIALQLVREAVSAKPAAGRSGIEDTLPAVMREARAALKMRFKLDPRMAAFRDDPEIVALLAEPGG